MRSPTFPLLFVALLAVGCSTDTKVFNVSVKNDTKWPMMLVLTKDQPQHEHFWASPEDLDDGRVVLMPEERTGTVDDLPTGRTATVDCVAGTFHEGSHAVLRVYRGIRLPLKYMLMIKPGPDRQDVELRPGKNRFVLHDVDGQLTVDPVPVQ